MYKLCALIAVCCAFCPRGSAAPRSAGADRSAQGAGDAEQVDRLQEEVDGQESILSKVGGKNIIHHIQTFLIELRWEKKYMRPLLFVAAG